MSVNVLGHSYLTYGAKWIMGRTTFMQPARSHVNISHQFLNSQGIRILKNDGFEYYGNILEYYLEDINAGVNWADIGWKNITHYFDPDKGKGILKFANAIDETVSYFNNAARLWREKNFNKAMFYLGAAVHIVQDLCEPHHASNTMSPGHRRYENWVKKHHLDYAVYEGGDYGRYSSPAQFSFQNALTSSQYLKQVKLARSAKTYHEVTKVAVPLAQLSTAEFFHFFLDYADM